MRNTGKSLIEMFIYLIFIIIIVCNFIVGASVFKFFKEINQKGLKSVVERIWEGAEKK
ncbi:MAG: hypothetical protein MUP27_08955 [Desulfobacterales bacterium]|nr:hypothetical protein [Desulfobacterales bacterium]